MTIQGDRDNRENGRGRTSSGEDRVSAAPAGTAPAARFGEHLSGSLPQSPAAERNKELILEVLRRVLPQTGRALEIASGTGQHAVHFAAGLPELVWQPSDADPELLDAIRRRVEAAGLANLRPPLRLDVLDDAWPVIRVNAAVCSNMIHIAPWAATQGLLRGTGAILPVDAPLVLYGPYRRAGVVTAPSNEAFDASLKARNPDWGLRNLEEVATVAARHGFALEEVVEMPANNLIVVFRRG
jgi:hypothetical protein